MHACGQIDLPLGVQLTNGSEDGWRRAATMYLELCRQGRDIGRGNMKPSRVREQGEIDELVEFCGWEDRKRVELGLPPAPETLPQ